MNGRFWIEFFDELEKEASAGHLNPLATKSLLRHLSNLGKIGLFGTTAYLSFKGVKAFANLIDRMTTYPT